MALNHNGAMCIPRALCPPSFSQDGVGFEHTSYQRWAATNGLAAPEGRLLLPGDVGCGTLPRHPVREAIAHYVVGHSSSVVGRRGTSARRQP